MLDVTELPPFSTLPIEAVAGLLHQGASDVRQDGDPIGSCMPETGGVAACYEDFLTLLTCRLIRAAEKMPREEAGNAAGAASTRPQKDAGQLKSALNRYIRDWMFGEPFDPLSGDGWHLLMLPPLTAHIVRVFSSALSAAAREE